LQKELKVFEKAIDDLLDRIVETTNASVISVYENRIAKLERRLKNYQKRPSQSYRKENLSNSRYKSSQTLGNYGGLAISHCKKQCSDYSLKRSYSTSRIRGIEHQKNHIIQ